MPCAPNWLIPTPWPKPPPSMWNVDGPAYDGGAVETNTVSVSVSIDRRTQPAAEKRMRTRGTEVHLCRPRTDRGCTPGRFVNLLLSRPLAALGGFVLVASLAVAVPTPAFASVRSMQVSTDDV